MMQIPAEFQQTIRELHGESGSVWLAQLPDLVADCERRWDIRYQEHFSPLSYNYVALALRANGQKVVLKLGVPNPELTCEAAALRLFAGQGMAQLLDADEAYGILLLEYVHPGTPLALLEDDEQRTEIAGLLMRQLWRPAPENHPFPSVAKWAAGLQRLRARFNGGTGPLESRLVERAEHAFVELLASQGENKVLHGDFHHWNILSAQRQPWLVIDPKGLVGDPGYEVGPLLLNCLPQRANRTEVRRILHRRLDQLADLLEYDRQRLQAWGMAMTVLSAWWSIEDHGYGGEGAMLVAGVLAEGSYSTKKEIPGAREGR